VGHHNAQNGVQRGLLEVAIVIVAAPPLPVEIANHTEWWVQWLPLVGSAFVAIATLIGVILSNRTTLKISRQEREDARHRDHLQWRREELRRLGTEVVRAASDAIDEYSKVANLIDQPITPVSMGPVDQASRVVAANAEILRFLGAYDAARCCIELRDLMLNSDLALSAKRCHTILQRDRAAGLSYENRTEDRKAAESDFAGRLREVQVSLRGVGYAVEEELRQLGSVSAEVVSQAVPTRNG
jgi:hypothetical protein